MTPNDIVSNWQIASGMALATSTLVAARLLQIVQDAFNEIWNNEQFSFRVRSTTITTASGTAAYALPTDFAAPQRFLLKIQNSDITVDKWSDQDWYGRDTTKGNDQPTKYRIIYDSTSKRYQIEFYPTPDGVYSFVIPYYALPPTLVAGDALPLPANFVDAVEAMAFLKAYIEYNRDGIFNSRIKHAKETASRKLAGLLGQDQATTTLENPDVYRDTDDTYLMYEG